MTTKSTKIDQESVDDFAMAALVESQVQRLPLSREEIRTLELIMQNDELRFEYYGLVAIMQNFEELGVEADLLYHIKDSAGRLHFVNENQICQQDYLLGYEAQIIGVEPISKISPTPQQYILYNLGLVLNFNDFKQARLSTYTQDSFMQQVAETKNTYGYVGLDLTQWTLQVEDRQGQITRHHFSKDGRLDIDITSIINWQLVKEN
jgi:hypothetical protein